MMRSRWVPAFFHLTFTWAKVELESFQAKTTLSLRVVTFTFCQSTRWSTLDVFCFLIWSRFYSFSLHLSELTEGIQVYDENGNYLGNSKIAAKKAITEVVISRIGMAAPGMSKLSTLNRWIKCLCSVVKREKWKEKVSLSESKVAVVKC